MIKCSKLVEVISKYLNFKELFAWGSNNHNKIKIYRVLLLLERFVGSAFFELTLAFYPRDLMGGSNAPGFIRESELLCIFEKLNDQTWFDATLV